MASSKDEAIDKYISQIEIHSELFLEHLYDKSVNMSFAEHFWLQTEVEQKHFMSNEGDVRTTDEQFEQRVKSFFGEYKDYSALYLDWYFDMDRGSDDVKFPTEMLLYIRYNSPDWSRPFAMRLDRIKEIK